MNKLLAIFPDIDRTRKPGEVRLETGVRIKRNNEWYLVIVKETRIFGEDILPDDATAEAYDKLLRMVYSTMLHYEIPFPVVLPSNDQREETERFPKPTFL